MLNRVIHFLQKVNWPLNDIVFITQHSLLTKSSDILLKNFLTLFQHTESSCSNDLALILRPCFDTYLTLSYSKSKESHFSNYKDL